MSIGPSAGFVTPEYFDSGTKAKLRALEFARAGKYGIAMEEMGIRDFKAYDMFDMPVSMDKHFTGRKSFERFLDSMEVIADKLEERGY